ncbi:hypothetical protein WOSG25_390040 [Weissella oryzae SG25]|uniref:Uncharacterized protein n=1 Tax=Weissella oryzae (strain DSM 25784 / JCM 18191 / LMG 30913 / SG25) TaxID=1329250 RepID=A0A069CXW8_WEIOS|nr:ArpU family phage packaging/lysis transcriptional regulator [Weissella oryzae]GAK32108.1 hypothetical protein WOSG25_390040 [Weissella oryzae SG25]
MALLPELDEARTVEKARYFFDKELPTIKRMAHKSYVDVKSPIISGMPSSRSINNATDEKLTNHAYAEMILDEVIEACKTMKFPHRDIIELRYFKMVKWNKIFEQMGYSESRGYQLIREAFLQFAWAFADVEDLRVFVLEGAKDKSKPETPFDPESSEYNYR